MKPSNLRKRERRKGERREREKEREGEKKEKEREKERGRRNKLRTSLYSLSHSSVVSSFYTTHASASLLSPPQTIFPRTAFRPANRRSLLFEREKEGRVFRLYFPHVVAPPVVVVSALEDFSGRGGRLLCVRA